jgi:adenosylhomocysteine nucleosidase
MEPFSNDLVAASLNSAPIAVFTALAWENAAVRAQLRHVRREAKGVWQALAGQRPVWVMTSGIGPHRTQETLKQFADRPLSLVISVGCAGALVAGLTPGQLIVAPEVRMQAEAQKEEYNSFPVDARLLAQARAAAIQTAIPVAEGPLLTHNAVLFTSEEKLQQGRRSGALAVEMESGIHAAFAQARNLPFLALRVILDPVETRLPAVANLTTLDGTVRPLRAAAYVATHPQHLPVLLALKRSQAIVARTISRLCAALFPLL